MALVTVSDYRAVTSDVSTAAELVTARIEEAIAEVEAKTGRLLRSVERTELVELTPWGHVSPQALPVTVAEGSTILQNGYAVVPSATVWDLTSWPVIDTPRRFYGDPPMTELTYTGGYADGDLPRPLVRIICRMAQALRPSAVQTEYPEGAISVKTGDAAVTFADPVGGGTSDPLEGFAEELGPWRHPARGVD